MYGYYVNFKIGFIIFYLAKYYAAISDTHHDTESLQVSQSDEMMDLAFIKLEECANELDDYQSATDDRNYEHNFSYEMLDGSGDLDNFGNNPSSLSDTALSIGSCGRGRGRRGRPVCI